MRNKPAYPLESVDNALLLIHVLRDQGRVRVKDAAEQLGCAPSTAHRLMSMLVYRGFALQDDTHGYLPGPALGIAPAKVEGTRSLRDIALPQLRRLSAGTGETANLVIRVGTQVRFLASAESAQVLRVGDRQGAVLPARLASGGKAMLAFLPPARLSRLYRSNRADLEEDNLSETDFERLRAELRLVRHRGYALNVEGTETSVAAVGVAVRQANGRAVAAVSLSMPLTRYRNSKVDAVAAVVTASVRTIEADLRDHAEVSKLGSPRSAEDTGNREILADGISLDAAAGRPTVRVSEGTEPPVARDRPGGQR